MAIEHKRNAIVIVNGLTIKGRPKQGCWWSDDCGTHVAISSEMAQLLKLPLPRHTCLMCTPDSIWRGPGETQISADIEFAVDLRSSANGQINIIARNRADQKCPYHFVGIGTYTGQIISLGSPQPSDFPI